MRALIAAAVLALAAACAHAPVCPNPTTGPAATAPTPDATPMSDPEEYRERPISREAGAAYFGETGLGDPYAVGFPLPVLLALMRAYPDRLGEEWGAFAAKFGFLPREGDLPVGFHLTKDPLTGTAFVMTNCELCHAERLRVPSGELFVAGLGNKRVRIHAYEAALMRIAEDPGLTADRIAPLAHDEAAARGLVWPYAYARLIVEKTIANLKARAGARGAGIARLEAGLPGRVATIESFALALAQSSGHPVRTAETIGWAKIPDVANARYKDTLSFDGVGTGAPTALAVEADVATGVRAAWFDAHRHIGTSLWMFLRDFDRTLPFPGPIDEARARRGHDLFVDKCAGCHGRYEAGRAVAYRERVIPLDAIGTDPARARAVTPEFVQAANAVEIGRGLVRTQATGGYVPPPLVYVWARAPYGHAGQWPSLAVLATPPAARPRRYVVAPDAPYDLDAVGVRTRDAAAPPQGSEYVFDGDLPGLGTGGHPFLADLGQSDAAAVIEFLKTL